MGGIRVFCLNFPPLEYILTLQTHSTYVIVLLGKIIDVYNDKGVATYNRVYQLRTRAFFTSKSIKQLSMT